MIIFLVTDEHRYTLKEVVAEWREPRMHIVGYTELFGATHLQQHATYVFTDLDRLPAWRIRVAARIYRGLRDQGVRVLNDPARIPSRYGLLRRLANAGISSFNAYRVEEGLVPARWPVFLRSEGSHDAPLSDLLHDWEQARQAIDAALVAGVPLTSLVLIEYAAEPVSPGLYRKLGMYKIGASIFADVCVHDTQWLVKYGTTGCATPELYADDLRIVRDNPFRQIVEAVFDLARIEYGRADFGLVGGKVQLYEINTNPTLELAYDHPSADRIEGLKIVAANVHVALRAIDTPER